MDHAPGHSPLDLAGFLRGAQVVVVQVLHLGNGHKALGFLDRQGAVLPGSLHQQVVAVLREQSGLFCVFSHSGIAAARVFRCVGPIRQSGHSCSPKFDTNRLSDRFHL